MESPEVDASPRAGGFSIGRLLRDQLRNIAPFATLLCTLTINAVANSGVTRFNSGIATKPAIKSPAM